MNPEPAWRHDVRTAHGHTTIGLTGQIDMTGAADLQDLLDQAVGTAVVNPGAQVRRVLHITGVLDTLAEETA